MAKKNLSNIMIQNTVDNLNKSQKELISVFEDSFVNKESGEVTKSVRIEAEIAKGNGEFSRCRFAVKIPNGDIKVTEAQLEDADYAVTFENLAVSYIDSQRNVFFRADDYYVEEV